MAKFFVTNNASLYEKIKSIIEHSPFEINADYKLDGVYAITVHKLQVDNQNFLNKRQDFIIQTGTCVYNENSGKVALEDALNRFYGDVQIHREDYIGNFGCFIKKGDRMVAFNEGAGFYDIFYYNKNGEWLIGTSLIEMARALSDRISINKSNVLEELTRYAIFDNCTYFNDIKRLSGDQFLNITMSNLVVEALDLKVYKENPQDYKTRAKNIAKEMKYVAGVMFKNFGQTTLRSTGGFDSRMTLAAYLSAGLQPKLTYGYGNGNLAESKMGDVEVNKKFSSRYNLEFSMSEWNDTKPLDKLWDEYIDKYGELIYDGCEDTYKYYTNNNEKFLSFGYIGEIYREFDWSKDIPSEKMTLKDYLLKFHINEPNKNLINADEFLINHWLAKWEKLNLKYGIETEFFNKEDLIWLMFAYRSSADNHMVNLINQYKYAHYLMSDMRIVRNAYLDFNEKYNGKFMIQILNEAYPDILEVPFFTHCHYMNYNPKTMMVEELQSNIIMNKIKPIIRLILPSSVKCFINRIFKRSMDGTPYLDEVYSILHKDKNDEKLKRLVGAKVYDAINININHVFILRGIILCKTFDRIGIKY